MALTTSVLSVIDSFWCFKRTNAWCSWIKVSAQHTVFAGHLTKPSSNITLSFFVCCAILCFYSIFFHPLHWRRFFVIMLTLPLWYMGFSVTHQSSPSYTNIYFNLPFGSSFGQQSIQNWGFCVRKVGCQQFDYYRFIPHSKCIFKRRPLIQWFITFHLAIRMEWFCLNPDVWKRFGISKWRKNYPIYLTEWCHNHKFYSPLEFTIRLLPSHSIYSFRLDTVCYRCSSVKSYQKFFSNESMDNRHLIWLS